jgi:hypothetical protein
MFDKTLGKLLEGYKKFDQKKVGDFNIDNPERKQEADWYASLGWSVLHDYVNDNLSWGDNRNYYAYSVRRISTLRDYARGDQPIQKYQDILCPEESYIPIKTGNGEMVRKAMMNISFSPPKIFPIFKTAVKAQLLETNYDFDVSAIDPTSGFERDLEIAYKKIQLDPIIKDLKEEMKAAGVPIPKDEELFETEKEIDVFYENGGFKLQYEIELKKALTKTLAKSDYDGIRDMVYDDAIDLGLYITKSYIDDVDGVPKIRYVDPEYFIGAWDRHHDKRDMWLAAEMIPMTLTDLMHKTKLTKEQAEQVMQEYGQRIDTNAYTNSGSNYVIERQKTNVINDFRVWVLDCNFISTDTYKKIKYMSKTFGNMVFKDVPYNTELSPKDKERGVNLLDYKYEYEYGFKMIVGTGVVFDFGRCITTRKENDKISAKLSYHVYDTKLPSLVDRCIEFIDDACLATFKFRDALAKMPPPPRLQVESSAIDQINLGGVTFTALQVKDMFSQTGWLQMKSLSDHLEPVNGNYNAPITAMNLNIMQDFDIFQGTFGNAMNMIRQVTGVNEVMDASIPTQKAGYKVSRLAYDTSKNTLKPLMFGYERVFLNTLKSCNSLWLQVASMKDPRGAFKSLGVKTYDVFKMANSVPERDFDVVIQTLPSEEERQLILQQLIGLRDSRMQTGVGGIAPDVYFMIYRIVKSGNLSLAQYKMSQAVERQRKQDMEEADRREQANTERLMASAQEANKAKAIEGQMGMQKEQMKYDLELRNTIVTKLLEQGLNEQDALMKAEMTVAQTQGKSPMQVYQTVQPFLEQERQQAMQEAQPQQEEEMGEQEMEGQEAEGQEMEEEGEIREEMQ